MNLEKVIFGFFIVLAATLNFGFVYGDPADPAHHHLWEFFAAHPEGSDTGLVLRLPQPKEEKP